MQIYVKMLFHKLLKSSPLIQYKGILHILQSLHFRGGAGSGEAAAAHGLLVLAAVVTAEAVEVGGAQRHTDLEFGSGVAAQKYPIMIFSSITFLQKVTIIDILGLF